MRRINVELVVGAFVILGIVSFTYMAVILAGVSLFEKPGYTLTAVFNSTSGLRTGAVVEGAGVQIGTVTAIEFDNQMFQSVVSMKFDDGVEIQKLRFNLHRNNLCRRGVCRDKHQREQCNGSLVE